MEANRNIRLSIREHVETLLFDMGYENVYDESNMREWSTPSGRYIFLIDSSIKPTITTLPFIVIELQNITREPFELGNDKGRNFIVFIHVFGRNRGERDDIASYLQDNLARGITYYDFSSGIGVAYSFTILRLGGILVSDSPITGDGREEASLSNWTILSFKAMTQQ